MVDSCKRLGKEPGICKGSPGFIVKRLLQIWFNESSNMYDEGIAESQDIDTALKAAYDFTMEPCELCDLVGLDICIVSTTKHYRELMREQFSPPRCLIMKVKAGDLGRKTGKGFMSISQKSGLSDSVFALVCVGCYTRLGDMRNEK